MDILEVQHHEKLIDFDNQYTLLYFDLSLQMKVSILIFDNIDEDETWMIFINYDSKSVEKAMKSILY